VSAYDRIIGALHGAGMKVAGREPKARAQCPVHHSRGLSLSVRRFNDRAVVHCFAGCEDVDVLAELGLEVRDLFDGPPPPGYTPPARREPTPWEAAMADLGIRNPPPFEHVLHRMQVEQEKERRAAGGAA
jgi:hypothetical protein